MCQTFCKPIDNSTPGFLHSLPEFAQILAHSVSGAIPWEDPGRLQSMGSQRVGHDWANSLHFTSTILCSVALFSFCFQSFPEPWSFPMSWFFASGSQCIRASASASVLPMILISFRIDWFYLLAVHGTLKSLLQHHNLKASLLWCSAFSMVQILHLYITNGGTIILTIAMSLCLQSDIFVF